jgi:acetylornithine deacetylase
MSDVVDLTLELCRIPSVTGSEAGVVDDLAARLRQLGAVVTRENVGGVTGRDNLLALADAKKPIDLLFTTHIDTVPPHIAPQIVGDEIVGRGVIDAKGIAAAMMVAWRTLLARKDAAGANVGLLFVVGEETNSDGAKQAAATGFAPPVKFFINGEPTDGKLCRAMKGVLGFQLDVEGKAGHSAYPEAGRSAVHQLITDLHALTTASWPTTEYGATTLNVGVVDGGVAQNVIAAQASAKIMMRPTGDPDAILERVRGLLSPTTTLQVLTKAPPVKLHTVPGEDTCIVAFGSDVPHLSPLLEARHGAPLLFGPGSILDAHTDHERVKLKDLDDAALAYERMALRLLEIA